MRRRSWLAPRNHDDFANKAIWQGKTSEFPLPAINRESALWNDAHALTKRDEIHDEVETIEFRGGTAEPLLFAQPCTKPSPGSGSLSDEQPRLSSEPITPCAMTALDA